MNVDREEMTKGEFIFSIEKFLFFIMTWRTLVKTFSSECDRYSDSDFHSNNESDSNSDRESGSERDIDRDSNSEREVTKT